MTEQFGERSAALGEHIAPTWRHPFGAEFFNQKNN
jgi:hypothetical protein